MRRKDLAREERKKRIIQIVIGVLLVGTMIISSFGLLVSNEDSGALRFNGFTFKYNQGQASEIPDFTTKANGSVRHFHALPLSDVNGTVSVQNIFGNTVAVRLDPRVPPLLNGAPYIATTFNASAAPTDLQYVELARFSYAQQLGNVFGGVLDPIGAYSALQRVDCTSTTAMYPVIALLTNETAALEARIDLVDGCVVITGDGQGILAATDVLLFARYGVIGNA